MPEYICIGVPYYLGEAIVERDEVQALRRSGIAEELNAEWLDIEPAFSAGEDPVVSVNRALSQAIQANAPKTPIVFASDCTSCLGLVKGLESRQPALLWYDAHGDFNTPATTPSGFLGGMPLAALVGRGNQHLMRQLKLDPIAESDITICDVRNLDPEEEVMLRGSEARICETLDELDAADLPSKPLYIHFDIDIVDCAEMPALGYPEPDGPSLAACVQSLRHNRRRADLAGVLFSLWNGGMAGAEDALAATLELIRAIR